MILRQVDSQALRKLQNNDSGSRSTRPKRAGCGQQPTCPLATVSFGTAPNWLGLIALSTHCLLAPSLRIKILTIFAVLLPVSILNILSQSIIASTRSAVRQG